MTIKIKKPLIIFFFYFIYASIETSFTLLIDKTTAYGSRTDEALDLINTFISCLMEYIGVLFVIVLVIELISDKIEKKNEN